ncbi:MAG TPA: hypothetical protein VN445_05035 [Rectinemataceae bacterium]|nr:hypothetical protein [Rectinemataceae bacterium]
MIGFSQIRIVYPQEDSAIVPIDVGTVDDIVHRATEGHHPLDVSFTYEDMDDPWKMNTLSKKAQCIPPSTIDVVFSDRLYIAKDQLPQPLLNRIVRIAAFPNPEFYKAQSLRLSVWDKPRIIGCAENFPRHIAVLRGCLHDLENLLRENGVLNAATAFGKTVAVAARIVPAVSLISRCFSPSCAGRIFVVFLRPTVRSSSTSATMYQPYPSSAS